MGTQNVTSSNERLCKECNTVEDEYHLYVNVVIEKELCLHLSNY